MSKKILAALLAVAMVLGVASVALAATPFPDIEGLAEQRDVALLAALELIKGYPDGSFGPDRPITRAEFCVMVVRALGLENSAKYLATQPAYPDVGKGHDWAWGHINISVTKDIIKGYPDGTFGPDKNVSEAEALTMVMRALGYKDEYLPGDWPLNFVIKGAEDAVKLVREGFIPDLPAPRAWVASLVVGMLDNESVTWNKTEEDFVAISSGKKLGERVLGLTEGKSGKITKVDATNRVLTFDADSEKTEKYAASVAILGEVDRVGDLVGYNVKTVKKGANVVFIQITTKEFISGKITAIDANKKTLTVGGTAYKVVDGFEAIKNGDVLSGTEINKLVELLETTAKVWVNDKGNVYRVDAQHLGDSGLITGKTVTIGLDGKLVNTLHFAGGSYEVPATATLIKNGADATWADLKVDDDCNFAVVGGKIVWLDAWRLELEKVQVIGKNDLGTNKKYVTVLVDGVPVEYPCASDTVFKNIEAGDYYNLSINRKGAIYAQVKKSSEVMVTTLVLDSLRTDYVWVDGKAKTTYKLIFTDGTVYEVPFQGTALKPDYYLNTHEITGRTTDTFAGDFKQGDSLKLGRQVDGTVTSIKVFRTLTDTVSDTVSGAVYLGGARYPVASNATITLNGVSKLLGVLTNSKATVKWDVKNEVINVITAVNFDGHSTVLSTTSDVDGNYEFLCANGATVKVTKTAIAMVDEVKATLGDIRPGMKLSYSAVTDCTYVEATTDSKAPVIDDSITVAWEDGDDGAGTITATITLNEEVQNPTVYINGKKVDAGDVKPVAANDRTVFKAKIKVDAKPERVSVSVTVSDYAGNQASKTVRDLTFSGT